MMGRLKTYWRWGTGKAIVPVMNVLTKMAARGAADRTLLDGTKTAALIDKWAPWIWQRHGGEPEIQELSARGFRGLARKIRIGGRPIGEVALMGLKRFDLWTVAVGFQVAYDSIYEMEMRRHGDDAKAERRAGKMAAKMIRDFHPPSLIHERSNIQTSHEFIRALTPFSGQRFKNLQAYQYHVLMPLAQAYEKGGFQGAWNALWHRGDDYNPSVGQKALFMAAIPAIVMGFLMRRRPPTEEEFWKDLIAYPISSFPVLGPAVTFSLLYGEREPAMTPTFLHVAENLISVASDISEGEIDLAGKTGKDALRGLALWTGLPDVVLQFGRTTVKKMIVDGKDVTELTPADYLEMVQARIMSKPE